MRSWPDALNELTSDHLSTLLALATSPGGRSAWMPTSSEAIDRARIALESVPEGGCGRPGAWLDEVADPATPLARLLELKHSAKELLHGTNDPAARTAVILVYHAAVAAAFARHSTVISSQPLGFRLGLYDGLGTALRAQPIGAVFRAAVERYLSSSPPGPTHLR